MEPVPRFFQLSHILHNLHLSAREDLLHPHCKILPDLNPFLFPLHWFYQIYFCFGYLFAIRKPCSQFVIKQYYTNLLLSIHFFYFDTFCRHAQIIFHFLYILFSIYALLFLIKKLCVIGLLFVSCKKMLSCSFPAQQHFFYLFISFLFSSPLSILYKMDMQRK